MRTYSWSSFSRKGEACASCATRKRLQRLSSFDARGAARLGTAARTARGSTGRRQRRGTKACAKRVEKEVCNEGGQEERALHRCEEEVCHRARAREHDPGRIPPACDPIRRRCHRSRRDWMLVCSTCSFMPPLRSIVLRRAGALLARVTELGADAAAGDGHHDRQNRVYLLL